MIIEREDFKIIRELAKKYNLSVADFGRSIVRQSDRAIGREIRVTKKESDFIKILLKKTKCQRRDSAHWPVMCTWPIRIIDIFQWNIAQTQRSAQKELKQEYIMEKMKKTF